MAISTAVLQGGIFLGTTTAALYTVPASRAAWVKRAVFTNTSNAAVTFTVSVSRAGGGSFVLISARSVPAGGSDLAPELVSLALGSGDGVSASASVPAVVSVVISGLVS